MHQDFLASDNSSELDFFVGTVKKYHKCGVNTVLFVDEDSILQSIALSEINLIC